MKNKYSDGSLRRYIEHFFFRHVFLHEQVFLGKFVPSPLMYLPRTTAQTKMAAWAQLLEVLPFRPMLKVKLTSSVLKQTLLGKTQVLHL